MFQPEILNSSVDDASGTPIGDSYIISDSDKENSAVIPRMSKVSSHNIRRLSTDSESDDELFKPNRRKNKNILLIDDSNDDEQDASSSGDITEDDNAVVDPREEEHSISDSVTNSSCLKSFISNKRISNDVLTSTPVLVKSEINDTPTNPDSGKRLLNVSTDTPRTIKQTKSFITPRTVVSHTILSSSESGSDSDAIIENSEDEEEVAGFSRVIKQKESFITPRSDSPISLSSESDTNNSNNDRITEIAGKSTMLEPLEKKAVSEEKPETTNSGISNVSPNIYREQREKVQTLQSDYQKTSKLLQSLNLNNLPDKGQSLQNRHKALEQMLLEETTKFSTMKITETENNVNNSENVKKVSPQSGTKLLTWNDIEQGTNKVLPKTFGKMAMSTYNAQKSVMIDRLQQVHSSIATRPKDTDVTESPKGLKIELMPHQKTALSWLMWRENQKPSGGILADDMGLGKTLTMLSLMLKFNEIERGHFDDNEADSDEENERHSKPRGGTLVICPASLINQWSGELERRVKGNITSVYHYHGPKRETKARQLAQYGLVVTTYNIISKEAEKNGAVFRIKWRRIILDEAHQIRNYKSQMSEGVCKLAAKSRWALTGTPVQNKELDMFALLKFLRLSPFDDIAVWKRWVGDKSVGGSERLHMVISSIMLRRTKSELIGQGALNSLPERKLELIEVDLTKKERDVYNRILIFSRTLFAQYLHQRAEKNQDSVDVNVNINPIANEEYFRMRNRLLKVNKVKDVQQHDILVLLLRLRQICCHPFLITSMLENVESLEGDETEPDSGYSQALDLLDQLNNLTLDENNLEQEACEMGDEAKLQEVVKDILNPSDPVFSKTSASSKINAVIKLLKEKVITDSDDKVVIVSQWPTFLGLLAHHLKNENIYCDQLDGKVPVPKRMQIVDNFNDSNSPLRILLLSLTAGGVGLNLVGANHLILLDLHWNPQLESQAQDRIYRVGQKKSVFIYKFLTVDTIEKRILDLQNKKLDMANGLLTGTVHVNKTNLTLQDLKMLFEI